MAFICFLVTTSVKLLLLCITRYLNVQIHFHLHSWFAYFCIQIANNSGVAFSLLFSIYYTIIGFNEVDIRIYLPEKVNITFKGI